MSLKDLGDWLQELGIVALGIRVVLHVLPRSFGVVRKAVRKSDQMVVAIKTLRGFVDALDMVREVDLVANLHHPNIIRLLDVCRAADTNQRGALVFE
jgi:serine/threonine protein kinase